MVCLRGAGKQHYTALLADRAARTPQLPRNCEAGFVDEHVHGGMRFPSQVVPDRMD